MPNRVRLFRQPILDEWVADGHDLEHLIAHVVIHEIGHHFGLSDDDTLILRGDQVTDSVTLTLAPRLQSKLILLERVPREVSL